MISSFTCGRPGPSSWRACIVALQRGLRMLNHLIKGEAPGNPALAPAPLYKQCGHALSRQLLRYARHASSGLPHSGATAEACSAVHDTAALCGALHQAVPL